MALEEQQSFQIGDWIVKPLSGSITGPTGLQKHLEPKVIDVIVYLAQRAGEVVTRENLLGAVWHGRFNADQQLTRAVSELRRAFEDESASPRYIATVHKRGYQLLQQVTVIETRPGQIDEALTNPRQWTGAAFAVVAVIFLTVGYFGLQQSQTTPTADEFRPADNTIAVLPFVNMSSDPDNQYLSDGISEEILNLLTRMPDLKVTGRTSSFAFRDSNQDLRSIGRTLGVRNLLEGSVRNDGEQVRVTAQLIDASDGTHIWSNTFSYTVLDLFELQDQIAAAIANALRLQVAEIPKRGRPTASGAAYSQYLRARLAANRLEWRSAIAHAEIAVQLDPQFGEAQEFLAYSYWYGAYNGIDAEVARIRSGAAASAAIAIDPNLLFAQRLHRSMNAEPGTKNPYFDATEWAIKRQPDHPLLLDSLVYNYIFAGYHEKALDVARRYVALDPLSLDANLDLFGALISNGRMDEAMKLLEIIDEISPSPTKWKWTIAGAQLVIGEDGSAIQSFEALLLYYGYEETSWVRELVTAARDPAQGQAILDKRIPEIAAALSSDDDFNWSAELTNWYMYLGYTDRYLELVITSNSDDDPWSYIDEHIWVGHAFRRQGFTKHPDYLRFVTKHSVVDIWEQYGAPDFCKASNSSWDCS